MSTKCTNCPLRRKPLFAAMSKDDVSVMNKFKVGELVIDAGTPIMMEGSNSPQLYTVLHGMGLRQKTLQTGDRQVLNFVFPGDFIGLQAGVMGEMNHSVEASTRMTLCVFDRSEFWNFFKQNTERAFDLTWLAAVEERLLGDALATVGQRSALEATAWAFVRIYQRAELLGLAQKQSVRFPFKQRDLADALGLSLVHMNKTLKKLRDLQLATWSENTLQIANLQALADVGKFDLEPLAERPLF